MMRGSPRAYVAATNPARSPTTPPPTATTQVDRSAGSAASRAYNRAASPRLFDSSPGGTTARSTRNPAAPSAPAYPSANPATFRSATTNADRADRPAPARSSAAAANRANSPGGASRPTATS